ncbi:hypothetical protein LIER_38891 [Lithospermum erythrorhizon]|uniref:F-box domain-containing protein n=1 Tax=Lithospermum erythrorhizon TaxID=34254 RepID=A0AAV3QAR6_LITER
MSDIPQEIVTEMLIRLPVEPLLRFRCVCKPWCALIDSQEFIKLHMKQNLESDRKLFLSGETLQAIDFDTIFTDNVAEIINVDPPVRVRSIGIEVIGCCNGLVSLYGSRYNRESVIMMWNPNTRKFQELPCLGKCDLNTNFGFGYDVPEVEFLEKDRCKLGGDCGVFAVGALHWVVGSSMFSPLQHIFAFDLATEKCQLVPQPECYVSEESHMDLAVLRGHLCLLFSFEREYADIWIMKDYGVKESWTKLASFVNSDLLSFGCLFPMSFSKSGKQILLNKDDEGLICYDPEEKSTWNVNLQGTLKKYLQFGVCSESLVRLRSCVPTDAKGGDQGLSKKKKSPKSGGFLSTGFKLVL